MSQFSHLIEINDLQNPSITKLTREELWVGLVLRAENPVCFVRGLDSCTILGRRIVGGELLSLRRELRFGAMIVRDRVSFSPLESVRYEVEKSETYPASKLIMRIEEPQPDHLFVRFEYSNNGPDSSDADVINARQVLRCAYTAADIDTIREIRRAIAERKLH